jgi:hypothetical protein
MKNNLAECTICRTDSGRHHYSRELEFHLALEQERERCYARIILDHIELCGNKSWPLRLSTQNAQT